VIIWRPRKRFLSSRHRHSLQAEHFASVASAGRAGPRLASRKGDGRDSMSGNICARQIALEVLNARRSHSLTPQQHSLGRIAEPARILLAHDKREESAMF